MAEGRHRASHDQPFVLHRSDEFPQWITKGAQKAAGACDRKNFRFDLESQLFLAEVRCLEPDIVVFQGTTYGTARFKQIRESVERVTEECHVLVHPSNREKGGRRPREVTLPRPCCHQEVLVHAASTNSRLQITI